MAIVTGCAGFIGSHLSEALLEKGESLLGIDCFTDNYDRSTKLEHVRRCMEWDTFEFLPINLAAGQLEDIVSDHSVIFHLAGEPGVRSSWGRKYRQYAENNIHSTQQLLEAVKAHQDVRMVYASSSSVYGNASQVPTPETSPTRPLSPYGQTKLSAEQLCDLYRESYGLDLVSLRYFTVYGPRQRPDMAFHIFCKALLEGSALRVFGNGSQTRDFTYVDDIVAATILASSKPVGTQRTFNIGGGSPASLSTALEMLGQISGRDLNVDYGQPERGDVKDTAADTSAAVEVLGYSPHWSLREGLASEFEWMDRVLTHKDTSGVQ